MKNITKNQVVGFTYTLRDAQNTILDESKEQTLEYLHGFDNIIPGLEKNLEGLVIGDKKVVKVSPEEGYGTYQEDLLFTFPKTAFPDDLELKVGIELEAQTPQGAGVFRVKEIQTNDVIMDANHPLAGETLFFDVEIKSIREATKEELEHGHVHGEGHHHHHH